MSEPEKDQPQPTGESEVKGLDSVWGSDFFQHGLETFDKAVEPKQSDEECPQCVKDRQAKEAAEAAKVKPPYKVLKVQGKEIPVGSEEELIALAQKGVDYTQKTQTVAEDRKKVEGERTEFSQTMDKFNELMERLNKGNVAQAKESIRAPEPPPPEKTIEEEYGIDPELADPWAIKMATDMRAVKGKNDQLEQTVQLFLMDKIVGVMRESIGNAVKEFPINDIVDPSTGKSLTQAQFVGILKAKLESPDNKGTPLPQIALDAVRELHMSQKMMTDANTEKVKGEVISEDISPEEFKAKHPKLFAKLSDQNVADYLATRGQVPPTLKSKGAEIDTKAKSREREGGSVREMIDAAFEDEDILASFNQK